MFVCMFRIYQAHKSDNNSNSMQTKLQLFPPKKGPRTSDSTLALEPGQEKPAQIVNIVRTNKTVTWLLVPSSRTTPRGHPLRPLPCVSGANFPNYASRASNVRRLCEVALRHGGGLRLEVALFQFDFRRLELCPQVRRPDRTYRYLLGGDLILPPGSVGSPRLEVAAFNRFFRQI